MHYLRAARHRIAASAICLACSCHGLPEDYCKDVLSLQAASLYGIGVSGKQGTALLARQTPSGLKADHNVSIIGICCSINVNLLVVLVHVVLALPPHEVTREGEQEGVYCTPSDKDAKVQPEA